MKVKFDRSTLRYYVFHNNRLVWFDSYEQAEDWIRMNHLEDEE